MTANRIPTRPLLHALSYGCRTNRFRRDQMRLPSPAPDYATDPTEQP